MEIAGMNYNTLHVLDYLKIWQIVLFFICISIIGYGVVKGTMWIISQFVGKEEKE